MRTLLWMAVAMALAALPLGAAEKERPAPARGRDQRFGDRPGGQDQPPQRPPDRRPGRGPDDRQDGPPPGPRPDRPMGPPPGGPGWGAFDPMGRTEIFDAARQAVPLPAEGRKGVDLLEAQFGEELQAAIAEARLKLAKSYVEKVLALVPDAEKPKYQAVADALTARDEAFAAAQKELKTALDLVKTIQDAAQAPREDRRRRFGPPGGSFTSKTDILRTHFVLTDEQRGELERTQREGFDAMRKRTEELFAELRERGGPRDPQAFRRVAQAMRQIREEVEDQTALAVAQLLTAEQKKDYTIACAAIDTCRKKTKEAEEACRTKIVAAVGEEKAAALLGPAPGQVTKPRRTTEF